MSKELAAFYIEKLNLLPHPEGGLVFCRIN